jgi:anaerobic selenocysteine-containing dehydrogenase
MKIPRRKFLRILGVTTGGAVAFGGVKKIWSVPEKLFEQAKIGPGIETWKNTICRLCSSGCGIRVRLIDGIPVRITGNPIYPVNRGGMCPLGEVGLEVLFHPDRLQGPLRRVKNGSKNQWEPVSWENAITMVVNRLKTLRGKGNPHRFAVVSGEDRGLVADFFRRFLKSYGSPNFIFIGENAGKTIPYFLTQGLREIPGYSFKKVDYILNLGSNFLE